MFTQDRLLKTVAEILQSERAFRDFIGNIDFDDLFTIDTIRIGAYRCANGFRDKADTKVFFKSFLSNCYRLLKSLRDGTFTPKYYRTRVIVERGKERTIKPPTFECKIVQKILCDYIIRPLLEPKMIITNYASIKKRGTKKMYEDIERALRKAKDSVVITTDFKNYFGSISTELLFEKLSQYIRDERILKLMRMFSPDEYGLSLGNELSQVPASWFPSSLDHEIKDRLGIKSYFRYMDDTLAIVPIDMVDTYIEIFNREAEKLKLIVKEIRIIPLGENFRFCKERFMFNSKGKVYRLINPDIPRNERRKLRAFKEKNVPLDRAEMQYKGVRGMISSHVNTYKEIQKLDTLYAEMISNTHNIEKMFNRG